MNPGSCECGGFLCSLFDFSFHSFVTPRVIRVLYILAVVLFLISTVLMIIGGFEMSAARGIITLIIVGPLYFLVSVTLTRIVLELVMVFFRIGESVAKLAGETSLQPLAEPAADVVMDIIQAIRGRIPLRPATEPTGTGPTTPPGTPGSSATGPQNPPPPPPAGSV